MLREMYQKVFKNSNVVNLSGKSMFLQLWPTFLISLDDPMVSEVYNCKAKLKQQLQIYNSLLDEIKEDENEIPAILGSMLDTIEITVQKQEFNAQELIPVEYLVEIE